MPEHIDDEKILRDPDKMNVFGIQMQAEDFGGGLTMPFYGFRRPCADYFNSNLIIQNFVTCDLSTEVHSVILYDERDQGKGADAVCSLRMRHHLRVIQEWLGNNIQAKLTMTLMEYCVGQNKSVIVMQFFCMLNILFYPLVGILYLVPGHSHMIPDRVIAWTKQSIAGKNL